MGFTIKVNPKINTNLISKRLKNFRLENYAAKDLYKLYYPFIPMCTGRLAKNVTIRAGEIVHRMRYARFVYFSNRKFKKTFHPLASSRWDIAARPTRWKKLIAAVQKYLKRKGPILK